MEGSSTSTQQRTDLQDSFGESFDEEEELEESRPTDRLLSHASSSQQSSNNSTTSIPSQPQPTARNNAPAILPVSTDGVFANMSAKPESDTNKLEETPPVRLYIYKKKEMK
ncbi:hypothetical protein BD560DRAFT_49448 [Blakeslea trispora]|nr:hypothetical protein BD560DRAFT_49448 [Blakeslea trispora]